MRIVVLGLSITSSWGNGHATTYRALLRGLHQRGHEVLFLERDKPWYRENRDSPTVSYAAVHLYETFAELDSKYSEPVAKADLVIVGSYVPDGVAVGDWVQRTARGITAFYDIDTPVTIAKLERGDEEYLAARSIPDFNLYLSFTGGPTLRQIEREFGARMARALYCSVDPQVYFPAHAPRDLTLGYLGTYSPDRQPALERFLLAPARVLPDKQFAVAGPMYPDDVEWPSNVIRTEHLPPDQHRAFYNRQRFTLNITRADMLKAGYSPSVRLFEAGACGTPIISDCWAGLEELFTPGKEILVARGTAEMVSILGITTEQQRLEIGLRGRDRVLREHTAVHRARQLEGYVSEFRAVRRLAKAPRPASSLLRHTQPESA